MTPFNEHTARPPALTRTKIVATLGPASETPEAIERLIRAGVSVFRFNFSHGTLDEHAARLASVREIAARNDRPIACLGDLQGPKIRVGKVPAIGHEKGIMLEAGSEVVFRASATEASVHDGGEVILPTTYPEICREVEPGQRVLINDGAIRMLAVDSIPDEGELRCRVTIGGLVTSGKGINLPESDISAPAITKQDERCIAWAVEHQLDFLALSFVRTADHIHDLRDRLRALADGQTSIDIVAKIEKPQAVTNIDAITEATDAIMVARGDLGVEMDIARVPVAQKEIIARCSEWGKPCIVATQMLESMIDQPIPTRAEASDVANAIFDGADAVMLSAETATGRHPALVVETMRRIADAAELMQDASPLVAQPPERVRAARYQTAALAHGAWHIARDMQATVMVCWSQRGGTARYLSQNDYRIPIVAFSSDERATRRMMLLKGVTPIHAHPPESGHMSEWVTTVDAELLKLGVAERGDVCVVLAGSPLGTVKSTSRISVHRIGEFVPGDNEPPSRSYEQ